MAEKFHAIAVLGAANSRTKDFYDLWLLSRTFTFDDDVLVAAIRATFGRRRTELPSEVPIGLSDEIIGSTDKQAQWRGFLRREPLVEAPQDFRQVAVVVRDFLMPVIRR